MPTSIPRENRPSRSEIDWKRERSRLPSKAKTTTKWMRQVFLLIHFPHLALCLPHSSPSGNRRFRLLLLPVCLGEHRDGVQLLLLQTSIDSWQFLLRELLEVIDHILQFMAQRLGARHLIIRGLAVVSCHGAIELSQQFTNALFAGDHATFLGGHDL